MNWRERLDARIDHCPGCDDWRWDHTCHRCDVPVDAEIHTLWTNEKVRAA